MKRCVYKSIIALLLLFPVAGLGAEDFKILLKPPSEKMIGEVIFPINDTIGYINEKPDRLPDFSKKQLLLFFSKGIYYQNFLELIKANSFQSEIDKGIILLNSGHFATKNGKVFGFSLINKSILRIYDVNHRQGYFFLKGGVPSKLKERGQEEGQ